MNNKKMVSISVISVIVLVAIIIAISYAMFTANLTGTKENVLTTGYVTMNCAETNFNLTNTKAMTDAQGIGLGNSNTATCTLTSTMVGNMNVGYDIALSEVDSLTPSDAIGTDNVKIQVKKSVDSASDEYLAGSTANAGVLVSSLASTRGQYDTTGITGYKLDSAIVNGNHSILYTIKAWVASEGSSATSKTDTNGLCSDSKYTTQNECLAAGEIWGNGQKVSQSGGSFSFKLKIGATQVLS